MRSIETFCQPSVCEICGEKMSAATTMGMELAFGITTAIQLCQLCGPIELELMQLCREATIACSDN